MYFPPVSRPVFLMLMLSFFFTVLAGPAAFGEADTVYVKEDTWPATMMATRANYQTWRAAQLGAEVHLGPWHLADPVPATSFEDVGLPEREVNFDARDDADRRIWVRRNELVDGALHALECGDGAVVYLAREITSDAAASFAAGLGSDDGIKVWLNGELLLSNDVARVVAPDQELLELPLEAGDNLLLMAIYNISGGCGFYFSLAGDPLAAIWEQVKADFPLKAAMMERDLRATSPLTWFAVPDIARIQRALVQEALGQRGEADSALRRELVTLGDADGDSPQWLDLYERACAELNLVDSLDQVNFVALRRAITHLAATYPEAYVEGADYLSRLDEFERQLPDIQAKFEQGDAEAATRAQALLDLQRKALLANPLLDFDELLLVRRSEALLGLPQNWQGNCSLPRRGYDNELILLQPFGEGVRSTSLFKPDGPVFVGDMDLHFDADKLLFSMLGSHNRWQIWEMQVDGGGLRQVTRGAYPDVDNYDACYLPDGRIIFDSTRIFQGIPCVSGSDAVANLFIMDADGGNVRQLCFDQDHNWGPTLLNNGRVLFARWEYSDTAHYFTRLLFHMNPDGTNQVEYYGSNSYWPNSMFYSRAIPGHPTKVATIVSGHHGVPRMGELIILDPARGRHEADGVVQRIPGYGETVEPVIADYLVDASWPKFLHPWPLSEAFFLVSCKPAPHSPWGVYLVDIFDNMLLLHEEPGYALFEPIPLRARPAPPAIPDRVDLDKDHATVYLMDVYEGPGLKNVPRGTVDALRVYAFHYTYRNMGGHEHVGVEGPWDVRRILGTVPVLEDGSAYFNVPANTPIAVQPLDTDGRALQVMRSWFTAMPGEVLSCVGCHESQNTAPPTQSTLAARRAPDEIAPWYGAARGFSFRHEVQPVLDRHCVGCHGAEEITDGRPDFSDRLLPGWKNFTESYLELHPYVRRPGPESDYHLQVPLEWHADTSELIQMLRKGHGGVQLDDEAWDRLITWIDLNVPDHGRWTDHAPIPGDFDERRAEMRARYACLPEDLTEAELTVAEYPREFIKHEKPLLDGQVPELYDWPFDKEEAVARQAVAGAQVRRTIDLRDGVTMEFVLVPPGEFVMGGDRHPDELPLTPVRIDDPFWLSVTEVTNEQYKRFNPEHNSRYINQHHKDHTTAGYPANRSDQPVIRINWHDAVAFTDWMAALIEEPCTLPTEAQWEWACRAGSDDHLFFGDLDADFSIYANLADYSMRKLAVSGVDPQPIPNPNQYQDFLPKDARYDDGERVVCAVGQYGANPWGLHDMHGNVSEWTLSLYRAYPYDGDDGRNDLDAEGKRVVRGGSWRDRPMRARSAFRLAYQPWQGVFNVGFRVAIPGDALPGALAAE